jgi:predicted HTH transcriptional regulator
MNQPLSSIPDKPHASTPLKAPKSLKRHNVHPSRVDQLYHDDVWNIDLKADRQLAAEVLTHQRWLRALQR